MVHTATVTSTFFPLTSCNAICACKKYEKSTPKYTRIDEYSSQLFDAVYKSNFELAKIIIDDSKADVNIKDDCGESQLIAVCQQTILVIEEEAVKFLKLSKEKWFHVQHV